MSYGMALYGPDGVEIYNSDQYLLMWIANFNVTVGGPGQVTVPLPSVTTAAKYGVLKINLNSAGEYVGVKLNNGSISVSNSIGTTATVRIIIFQLYN